MSSGNLCLRCQNAVPDHCGHGCSWSREFRPVEGWTARPTVYLSYAAHGRRTLMRSFAVRGCPEFVPDPRRKCPVCGRRSGVGKLYCSAECWGKATLAPGGEGCYTGK